MMDMFTDEMRRNPHPLYDEVRNHAPVFQMPGTEMWMLFDYESVKRALTDHEAFSSVVRTPAGGRTPDWLVFSDPPRHTKLRGLILRAFTPRSIAGLESRVRELSRELLAPHLERGELELVADYSAPLPVIVIAELLGIPPEDRPRFLRWGEVIMNLSYNIEPQRFDIGRNPNPHLAFGHGIHFCLGAALSRMEARVALGDLLERMKDFSLASAEPWEPREALHVHGPRRLPLRFEPARRQR